ncbi:MAG TPA: hypothetical protein VGP93_11160 [Polyangiaceae bacterium]|nr:hypothetical protein [Polyangiaceae bacterium]
MSLRYEFRILALAVIASYGAPARAVNEGSGKASSEAASSDECEPGAPGCDVELEQGATSALSERTIARNWLSLSLAQDFLAYGSVAAVCPTYGPDGTIQAAPEYRCFAGDDIFPGPVYGPAGNEIRAGFGRANLRLLLGFDRLFGDRWLLGVRVGYALGGGPTFPDGSKFMPLHLEARAALFFGHEPFAALSVRPYAVLGAGLSQASGSVPVEVYLDEAGYAAGQRFKVDAWRRAGNGFAALGLGLELPISSSALRGELRLLQFFGSTGTGLSIGLGYALGF